MKRSELPPRRKPIARSTKPLKRTSLTRSRASSSTHTRTRRSRPPAKVDRKAEIRAEVYRRDGRCRLERVPGAGMCHGPLTPHHRRKGGQGGGYTTENLVALCAHHNDELEADADLALLGRTMGLVLKRGDEWGPLQERFWARVNRAGPIPKDRPELGPCWLWTGPPNPDNGYGYVRVGGRTIQAHRFALGCVEALLPDLEVDHLCRVRLCLNPRHLEQVTGAVNRRRQAEARPRPTKCAKGHQIDGTQAKTRIDGTLAGLCLTCRNESRRAFAERQRDKENSDAASRLRADRERTPRQGPANEAPGAPATSTPARAHGRPSSPSRRSDRPDPSQRVAGRS